MGTPARRRLALGRALSAFSPRQRLALGRALSFRPNTLLLDEPLSALDDETRKQMYQLLKHVQQETGVTTLHVTHHMFSFNISQYSASVLGTSRRIARKNGVHFCRRCQLDSPHCVLCH